MKRLMMISVLMWSGFFLHGQTKESLVEEAKTLYEAGRYEDCIDYCSRAININPKYSVAYHQRGWAYLKMGDISKAKDDFDRAIKTDRKNAKAYNGRAWVRFHQKKYKKALRDCKKALKIDPNYSNAYNTRFACLKALKKFEAAREAVDRAIATDTENKLAWFNSGLLYSVVGQHEKAIEAFSNTLSLDPEYKNAYLNRAKARLKTGDYDGVISDAGWVVKNHPKTINAFRYRGSAYLNSGQAMNAVSDFERALKLKPDDQMAKSGLEKAQRALKRPSNTQVKSGKKDAAKSKKKSAPKVDQQRAGQTELLAQQRLDSTEQEVPEVQFVFNDPCSTSDLTMPWSPSEPSEVPESVDGAVLAPFVELKAMAENQYNGVVSMAMEAMRLVYGQLSPKEEQHFQKSWAPIFDAPNQETLAYLNELVPLLGQFLAGRETLMRSFAAMQTLQLEQALAIAADSQEGYEAVMLSALDVNREIQSLLLGLKRIAGEIEAMGNPPNPLDAQCQARKRYKGSFPTKESKQFRELEGEWVGYVESESHSKYLKRVPIHYLFQYHVNENSFTQEHMEKLWGVAFLPMGFYGPLGASEVFWPEGVVEDQQSGRIEHDYESEGKQFHMVLERVGDELPVVSEGLTTADASRLKKLKKNLLGIWNNGPAEAQSEFTAPGNSEIVHDIDQPLNDMGFESEIDGTRSSFEKVSTDVTGYKGLNEYELTDVLSEIDHCISVIEEYNQYNGFYHVAAQNWIKNPPEESFSDGTRLTAMRKNLTGVYAEYLARVENSADSQGLSGEELKALEKAKKEEALRLEGVQESIKFHESMVQLLNRNILREQSALENETDFGRQRQLAFRLIQLQSNLQEEQDLADSYKTGVLIHRRSVFEEFANQKFIHSMKQRALRVDAVRRIKRGIERQIALLPKNQRGDTREIARRILDSKTQAIGDVGKARRLALAIHDKVQGHWEHESAVQEERIAELDETEFYFQTAVMAAGGITVGLGSAAFAATFGETAALTIWAPHIIGGVYGGTTGYIIGGPTEALKHSVSWMSSYGFMAVQFVDGWQHGTQSPNADWKDKLWAGTKQAGISFIIGKGVEGLAGLTAKTGMYFLGKDSRLFKPVFSRNAGPRRPNNELIDAARMKQDVDDAVQYMGVFKQKQIQYIKAKSKFPAGSSELAALEAELAVMSASINSSYHGKWLMKYKAHPSVRKYFNSTVNKSYDEMMPEMLNLLKQKGYDVRGLKFKPIRNASSSGSSSMDLDLALMERPGLKIRRNGKTVSLEVFQKDAQSAMNVAYNSRTGYSAVRSELNLTTSVHDEAFSTMKLLKKHVNFSEISQKDIAHIGKVVTVKVGKIKNDPVLSQIAKTQSRCRESSKEIKNMLLKRLRQQLKASPSGSNQAKQLKSDIRYWEDMLKRFEEMGAQQTNPYRLIELERNIRLETGGKGSQEVIQDLVKMFQLS